MVHSRLKATDACVCLQGKEDKDKEKRKKPKQARRLTGRCWMAEDFPMSLKQLLPLLEVIGLANKHIARVGKFLQKYGDMSLFPVKLQVRPLSLRAFTWEFPWPDFLMYSTDSP